MDISAYVDIPIMVIVYFFVEIIKRVFLKTDRQRSMIPVIAAATGAVISILIFIIWPMVSTNVSVLNAFASGAISGSAATGSNQIYKQITRFFTVTDDHVCDNCGSNH